MIKEIPTKIVIIDDNIRDLDISPTPDSLLIALRNDFGENNVRVFRTPNEGVAFVLTNLSSKTVVLLDMDLGEKEISGDEVFEEIRRKTSLVTVIIMSAKLSALSNSTLRKFINNHAFSAIDSNDSVKTNLPIIKNAVDQLSLRVDCAIEEWLFRYSADDRKKPFMTLKTGEKYSLDEILNEIRQNTDLGVFYQRGILKMAVELLARQKAQL